MKWKERVIRRSVGIAAACVVAISVSTSVRAGVASPNPPVLVAPSGTIADTTPEYSWQNSAGAATYALAVRDLTAANYVFVRSGLTGTSFASPTVLDAGHAYRWKMAAVGAQGGSPWGAWQSFDYGQAPDPPTPPILQAPQGTIADTSPTFLWQASTGAATYTIALRDVTAASYIFVRTGLTGASFAAPVNLDSGHAYRWKMSAIGPTGASGWSGWRDFDYGGAPLPPDPPTLQNPLGEVGDATPVFDWGESDGATTYTLAVRDVTAAAYILIRAGLTGSSFELPVPLNATHQYRWKMSAVGVGGASGWSTWRAFNSAATPYSAYALRFRGNGSGDIDRVKIAVDDPSNGLPGPPADIGAEDLTIEFWMKASALENDAAAVSCGNNIDWIYGNILLDRDRFNQGRKFGVSIAGGVPVFGVSGDGTGDATVCGTSSVVDDSWHHVALQRRRSDGFLWLYVDGALEASGDGPDGDVSYPDSGLPCVDCCGGGACDFSDPFIVLGAEKHDAGSQQFLSYAGLLDELRLSSRLRYSGASFAIPTAPFVPDRDTVGLYHLDEGNGDRIVDSSAHPDGPSPGERRYGGTPEGPDWTTDTPFPATPGVSLELVATGFGVPVAVTHAGDNRLFIVELAGQVRIFDGVQVLPTSFLDISSIVQSGGEQGLLSIAFHPAYATNGYFYVNYTDASGDTVIARYMRLASNPNLAAPGSGVPLLTIVQPDTNHNGGQLQFGPDGYLYIAVGDGGGSGDPFCFAQSDDSLLGKMLRVDVDQSVNSPPYHGIPLSNPYVGPGLPLDEIWSKGLRNPWRFSFDTLTGGMFIGDVGQGALEEIDYQPASSDGGENFGWKIMEGGDCFGTAGCVGGVPTCGDPELAAPIFDYVNPLSACASVTGGYVYRGSQAPDLYGVYLYGDYCFGEVWGARQSDGVWTTEILSSLAPSLYTFGQGVDGEVYVASGGDLYRVR